MVSLAPLLLCLCASAPPQVGRLFPTVGAIVGNSQAVYSGVITKLAFDPEPDRFMRRRAHLIVRVNETLKGPKIAELSVNFMPLFPEEILRTFVAKREPFLWLSSPSDGSLRGNLEGKMAYTYDAPVPQYVWFRLYEKDSIPRYVDYDSNVFTADFRVISAWKDLLSEARRVSKEHPRTVDLVPAYVPDVVALMCGDKNAFGVLSLPKDRNTDLLARRLMKEPDKVVAAARRRSRRVYREPKLTETDLDQLRSLGKKLLDQLAEPTTDR